MGRNSPRAAGLPLPDKLRAMVSSPLMRSGRYGILPLGSVMRGASYTGRPRDGIGSPPRTGRRAVAAALTLRGAEVLDTVFGDAMGYERQRPLGEACADRDGALQRPEGEFHALGILGEHRRDRLTGEHLVARFDGDDETDGRIDAVFDLGPDAAHGDDRSEEHTSEL